MAGVEEMGSEEVDWIADSAAVYTKSNRTGTVLSTGYGHKVSL